MTQTAHTPEPFDLVIVGAGAAGMAAAIFAGEAAAGRPFRILLVDGAARPGAKILASGGGRCNVTHDRVTADDYCGGPRPLIRNVLKAFDERATVAWMRRLGVELKVEPTGKLFPVTDQARTVLGALQGRIRELGVMTRFGARVASVRKDNELFVIGISGGESIAARRVIVATGGRSLPQSGSDGAGIELMRELGHDIAPITPALVPLVLAAGPEPGGRFEELAGVTIDVRLGLFDGCGKRHAEIVDSMLFTHFGVSGPAPMNLSRHWLQAKLQNPNENWSICMGHPSLATPEAADSWLQDAAARGPRRAVVQLIKQLYPERLAFILAEGTDRLGALTRPQRLELARRLTRLPLPVTGDRGWACAETTAGGVSLRDVDARTMESRRVPGLHIVGEMLDVDGTIGGYCFQWAWATGFIAGKAAAQP